MSTATQAEIDEIRKQMAQIRRELDLDMRGVVAGTEAATDWKYYVRLYPWAALGAAFAGGFLIIPRRRTSVAETAERAAEATVQRTSRRALGSGGADQEKKEARKKGGLVGMAFGFLGPIVMRLAQNYASQYVETWLAQQGVLGAGPLSGAKPPSGAGSTGTPPTL